MGRLIDTLSDFNLTMAMRASSYLTLITAFLFTVTPIAASAAECQATSGKQRVALLELYTSEGCSSCPTADHWLSRLPTLPLTTAQVIALAFHVDYWNDIGWVDPYSQALFSERQRQQSRRRGASFVFTPQLLLNGQDYHRAWVFEDIGDKVAAINQRLSPAYIHLQLHPDGARLSSQTEVRVVGDAKLRNAEVYLALYENNLSTAVKAGENQGETLRHDFVVRELVGPLALDTDGQLSDIRNFNLAANWKRQDLHLAVFVQQPQSGEVLQALEASCR